LVAIRSAPSDAYHLVGNTATKLFAVLDAFDASVGNVVTLYVGWANISGVLIGSAQTLIAKTAPFDGVYTAELSITPPAAAVFAQLYIVQNHTQVGTQTTGVFFAGVGCWDGNTAGSFQPARFPIHPGTTGQARTLNPGRYNSEAGIVRVIDRTRHARHNTVAMAFSLMSNADRALFDRLDAFNNGRNWDVVSPSLANPSGGSWPVLVVPGNTGLISAMLCDVSNMSFSPDDEWGRQDPPCWQGAIELTERT
jgi:hypothetical protein